MSERLKTFAASARRAAPTAHDRDLRTVLRAEAVDALERRLAKNHRHWSRWARRQGLGAFRFYDRDIPEFPLAVDCYLPADDASHPRLHVQEVETGWVQSEHAHAQWVSAVRDAIVGATSIEPGHIVHKQRPRRHAREQRASTGVAGHPFPIVENGLIFWVNLERYLDTGLFLDHRRMRAMVRARAAGKRVLNLFGYTGSFTVYAAAGGAAASETVDLSNTYLAWAQRNFTANRLDLARHRLVRADVLPWLEAAVRDGRRYDLVVCDPPTFSNSKRMSGVLDVQRDHPALIEACLDLLAPGGELYFSTNLRSFELDPALARRAAGKDITGETRAEDFRDARVHRAFLFSGR